MDGIDGDQIDGMIVDGLLAGPVIDRGARLLAEWFEGSEVRWDAVLAAGAGRYVRILLALRRMPPHDGMRLVVEVARPWVAKRASAAARATFERRAALLDTLPEEPDRFEAASLDAFAARVAPVVVGDAEDAAESLLLLADPDDVQPIAEALDKRLKDWRRRELQLAATASAAKGLAEAEARMRACEEATRKLDEDRPTGVYARPKRARRAA